MKKTLHIDEETRMEAKDACGASTDTETVRLGLEALIRQQELNRCASAGLGIVANVALWTVERPLTRLANEHGI